MNFNFNFYFFLTFLIIYRDFLFLWFFKIEICVNLAKFRIIFIIEVVKYSWNQSESRTDVFLDLYHTFILNSYFYTWIRYKSENHSTKYREYYFKRSIIESNQFHF